VPAERQPARFMLWEVCQVLDDPETAIRHLRAAVRENPVTTQPSPNPQRRILALAVPGDFQANLPLNFLLSTATTELHTLWLHDPSAILADRLGAVAGHVPEFDCIFIAIAEDVRHAAALRAADRLAASLGGPLINSGTRFAALSRTGAASLLQGIPHCIVPSPVLAPRKPLAALPAEFLRHHSLDFPLIIRPSHSHAGQGLARLDHPGALQRYLAAHQASKRFYLAPFIDFRSNDGQWRKYRIIFVDGRPYPYHLAIHADLAIWYYNAGMHLDPGKRREEARFLADIEVVFPPSALAALGIIAERVGLDYFGLNCTLMPDGSLLVFEVETSMSADDRDPPAIFAYKRDYVPRIFRAVEALIDRRIAGGRAGVSAGEVSSAGLPGENCLDLPEHIARAIRLADD
jgi:hypothetical protein